MVSSQGDRSEAIALELDRYEEAARAIVEQEAAVYGELPTFDFGTYTFLACYVPWADGDGMDSRPDSGALLQRRLRSGW